MVGTNLSLSHTHSPCFLRSFALPLFCFIFFRSPRGKDYFDWHTMKRLELDQNHEIWSNLQYYIVECSNTFRNCGGTADRLGPLPFHIRMAANQRRILLISWQDNRPGPLETFLLPPTGGIDWRFPDWLSMKFQQSDQQRHKKITTYVDKILRWNPNIEIRWLRVKYQSHDHGQLPYDTERTSQDEPTFQQVYHDIWRIFFTPTRPIARRIESELKTLRLIPGMYHSIHLRAMYLVEHREELTIKEWTQNSIRCATTELPTVVGVPHQEGQSKGMSLPTTTYLFVSDSIIAKEEAIRFGNEHGLHIIHRLHNHDTIPLHLEKDNSTNVEDFYDVFVDLLMMGLSQCTNYHLGGFGRLGSLISYDASCTYRMKAIMETCPLTISLSKQDDNNKKEEDVVEKLIALPTPLFFPIMNDEDSETIRMDTRPVDLDIYEYGFNFTQLSYSWNDEEVYDDPLIYEVYNATKFGVNLWARSPKIPVWMKKYFKWHKQQQIHHLNPQNWTTMKFLVMECLRHHTKCGGTSDRLVS